MITDRRESFILITTGAVREDAEAWTLLLVPHEDCEKRGLARAAEIQDMENGPCRYVKSRTTYFDIVKFQGSDINI